MTFKHDGPCPSPAAGMFDVAARGHPFSWTERKPLSWYEVFLPEVRAALVVDYSPGSGAMARACLNKGIQYVGICRTDQHCQWLTRILNKAALERITLEEGHLYVQDLATGILEHFKDELDEVKYLDNGVDEGRDDEEDESSDDAS